MRSAPARDGSLADRAQGRRGLGATKSTRQAKKLRYAALDWLEPRTLLATSNLPAPLVLGQVNVSDKGANTVGSLPSNTDQFGNESSPSIVIDPLDPTKVVATWTRFDPSNGTNTPVVAQYAYSTNSGATWSNPAAVSAVLTDPTSAANNPLPFAWTTDAQVAFDRSGNFYILDVQRKADNSYGTLLLNKFIFTGAAPTPDNTVRNEILQTWDQDQILKPTLAVNSNAGFNPNIGGTDTSFVDPTTSVVQNDPTTGSVYVAWATIDNNPNGNNNWNPNAIRMIASSDGGHSFGAPVTLNDNRNTGAANGNQHDTSPRLTISQGRADGTGPAAGQVTIVWDDFGTNAGNNPASDVIWSDHVGGVQAQSFNGATGVIGDATPASPNAPITTSFPLDLTNANVPANFSKVTVTVAIAGDPNISDYLLYLVAPDGTSVPLTWAYDANGNPTFDANGNHNSTLTGTNMGLGTGNVAFGTTFDDAAPRNIRNAANPYIGTYAPSGGTLSTLLGHNPDGLWQLQIVDTRNDTSNSVPHTGTLRQFELTFTNTNLTPGVDHRVTTTFVRGQVGAGGLVTSNATPFGIGPAPVLASDNTLGSFSPYQGRLYVAYVDRPNPNNNPTPPADNTNIFVRYSDDGGTTWSAPVQVNDDNALSDGFSEASATYGRPQFEPLDRGGPGDGHGRHQLLRCALRRGPRGWRRWSAPATTVAAASARTPSPTRPTRRWTWRPGRAPRPTRSPSGRSRTTSRPAIRTARPPTSASATARAWPSSTGTSTPSGRATRTAGPTASRCSTSRRPGCSSPTARASSRARRDP